MQNTPANHMILLCCFDTYSRSMAFTSLMGQRCQLIFVQLSRTRVVFLLSVGGDAIMLAEKRTGVRIATNLQITHFSNDSLYKNRAILFRTNLHLP
jgi:hypothetical protein